MTGLTKTNGVGPKSARATPGSDIAVTSPAMSRLTMIARSTQLLEEDFTRHCQRLAAARQRHDFDVAHDSLQLLQANLDLSELTRDLAVADWSAFAPSRSTTVDLNLNVGTLTLSDWYHSLLPPEKLVAISGIETAPGMYTLDYAIPLAGEASGVTFKPDPESTYQVLSRLSACGHHLRAYAHSQPGSGPGATKPSARDRETQRALETHYRVIGLVFSEDGYLRAYSEQLTFNLTISGTNVEVIDHDSHIYRLHPR